MRKTNRQCVVMRQAVCAVMRQAECLVMRQAEWHVPTLWEQMLMSVKSHISLVYYVFLVPTIMAGKG